LFAMKDPRLAAKVQYMRAQLRKYSRQAN
jgi:hypothetical protein